MRPAPLLRAVPTKGTPNIVERQGFGFRLVYRPDQVNECPGCGKCNWWVFRLTAECAFCGTALPMGEKGARPADAFQPRFGPSVAHLFLID